MQEYFNRRQYVNVDVNKIVYTISPVTTDVRGDNKYRTV